MEPGIRLLTEKKLAGMHLKMSFSDNRTGELWRSFMQRRGEIHNNAGPDLYSIQVYDHLFFSNYDPVKQFEKWAAVEVRDFESVPEGMDTFILPGGFYAVFDYHGTAEMAEETFRYILEIWLPGSSFVLDDRPHFEILSEKYKNNSPDSEEEIWIPVRPKTVPYSISPWLTVADSRKASEFYISAFGAVEVYRLEGDGNDLVCRLSIGGFEFWVSNGTMADSNDGFSGAGNIRLILSVPDPDYLFLKALESGAREIFPVTEEHGWRTGRLVDPFGIHWEICRQITW
jgi:AraC family transcriptional regulator